MAVRKRNAFLEGNESEDDYENRSGSDEAEEGRGGIGGRMNKRRKTGAESDEQSSKSSEAGADPDVWAPDQRVARPGNARISAPTQDAQDRNTERFMLGSDFEEDEDERALSPFGPAPVKLRPKSVTAAEKAVRKSGVIYISRVPPFMKPQTLRHFLAPHATKGLGRVFLTPEEHSMHLQRVKRGGNKKKSFTDGWVEFTSKTEAKLAAETLNGNIIGGKKGNFYHDDMWNIKYLKGFKWSHLTEQIASENAERAARLREEVRRMKEENKAFVEDIERGKMLDGMESKRKAKREKGHGGQPASAVKPVRSGMEFKQRKARDRDSRDDAGGDQEAKQRQVLSMIL